jgi:hypothetical protein
MPGIYSRFVRKRFWLVLNDLPFLSKTVLFDENGCFSGVSEQAW